MLSTIFSQEKNHNLNFLLANNAYGLSYEYQRFVKPDLSVGADLRFYDIRTDECLDIPDRRYYRALECVNKGSGPNLWIVIRLGRPDESS